MRTALSLALALLSCAGCSALKFDGPLHQTPHDAPTFARTPGRVNSSAVSIAPPLSLAWEADISAGVGDGGPVVMDSTLFIATMRGELIALQLRDGKKAGSLNLGPAVHGSPVVDVNSVTLGLSGTRESVVSYDLVLGRIRWRQIAGDVHASPVVSSSRIIVATTVGTVYALDRLTGAIFWKFEIPANTRLKGIRSSPAATDSIIIFGADDGVIYALHPATGNVLWTSRVDAPVQAPVSIAGGSAYVSSLGGNLYALRLADGIQRWHYQAGAAVYGTALVHDKSVFLGTTGGNVVCLDTTAGGLQWQHQLDGPVNSGCALAGRYLYVGTLKKELAAFDITDGRLLWSTRVEGRIKTTPIAVGDRLLVATDERTILSFRGSTP